MDNSPPLPMHESTVWLAYIDNSLVLSASKQRTQKLRDDIDRALREAQTSASQYEELLGVALDGSDCVVRPTRNRLWKLYQSLTAILHSHVRLTSQQMSTVAGHLTYVWFTRRDLLSIPSAMYHFVNKGYGMPRWPWDSVL